MDAGQHQTAIANLPVPQPFPSQLNNNEPASDSDQELQIAATPKNMTRIEIQTPNKKIKVIWFAEKKTIAPPAAASFSGE